MKKILLFTTVILAGLSVHAQNMDTIAAWTFPTGIDTVDIYPDVSISNNMNYYISAEDTVSWPNTNLRDVISTDGFSTFAGTATGWDNGENSKLWSIKFKAPEYSNIKISSRQFSDPDFPGPKYWKIQARLSGEDWIDVENGQIECGNDWATGFVNEIELPETFDNPGSTSIYVRWIMTSNMSTSGSDVESSGISKIDDVIITAEMPSGIGNIYTNEYFRFYPNPAVGGTIYIESKSNVSNINLYNVRGELLKTCHLGGTGSFNVDDLNPGIYFIEPVYTNNQTGILKKFIIQ